MIKIISGDHYLLQIRKRAVKADFLHSNDPLAMKEIHFEDYNLIGLDDLVADLSTVSLFYSKRLIIVSNLITFLNVNSSGNSNNAQKSQEMIQSILESISNNTELLMVEPSLNSKSAIVKFLQQNYQYKHYTAPRGIELQNWLCEFAENRNSNLDRATAHHLIQKVGSDLTTLSSEISKLICYEKISIALIDDLVVGKLESSIFDLLTTIFNKDYNQSLDIYYQQIKQGIEPLKIIATIIWQLQILAIVKTTSESLNAISKKYGIHKYPLEKSQILATKLSYQNLLDLINLCQQSYKRIRVDFVDENQSVLHFITRACNQL